MTHSQIDSCTGRIRQVLLKRLFFWNSEKTDFFSLYTYIALIFCRDPAPQRRTALQNTETESENCLGWRKPLRSSNPTINSAWASSPLSHVPSAEFTFA